MSAPRARVQRRPPVLRRLPDNDVWCVPDGLGDEDAALREAVAYIMQSSGKQLRPGLCFEAARFGPESEADAVAKAATAVELLHAGSLVHDDITDGGELRRGWESLVSRSGTCIAGMAASWLYGRALELITHAGGDAVDAFTRAARELCDGQMLEAEDLFDVNRSPERYLQTIEKKTGSLFWLATSLGAIAARAPVHVVTALIEFGLQLGLVFQMSDDILDIAGDERALGKPPGADLRQGVYTLPVIYAVEADPTLPTFLPQAALDDTTLEHVVTVTVECGAVDRALDDCEHRAALARSALREVGDLDPEAEQRLVSVLDYALERAFPEVPA